MKRVSIDFNPAYSKSFETWSVSWALKKSGLKFRDVQDRYEHFRARCASDKKANSKILILGNLVLHHSQYTAFVQLLRGSTVIGEGSGSNTAHIVYNNENNHWNSWQ